MTTLRIGHSRQSSRALAGHFVAADCARFTPASSSNSSKSKTIATRFATFPHQPRGEGVFTKAIQDALLENRVDVARPQPQGSADRLRRGFLILGAVPERGPTGVRSFRRNTRVRRSADRSDRGDEQPAPPAQILHRRPDLKVLGYSRQMSIPARKLVEQNLDATIPRRKRV